MLRIILIKQCVYHVSSCIYFFFTYNIGTTVENEAIKFGSYVNDDHKTPNQRQTYSFLLYSYRINFNKLLKIPFLTGIFRTHKSIISCIIKSDGKIEVMFFAY